MAIPTHNRRASLCQTLENLNRLRGVESLVRIYVVVDDCSDDTVEVLHSSFPEVRVLQPEGPPLWWSGSINLAAETAMADGCDFVWIWNDDIRADEHCLAELLKLATTVPGSIVGPKILELYQPARVFSCGGEVDWLRSGAGAFMRATETLDGPHLNEVRLVKWLPGMGTLIPAAAWKSLGGLDARAFPQYLSDADLGLRACKQGIPILVCPTARLFNDVQQTAEQIPSLTSLKSKLWSRYFHGSLPVRWTFLWRHCPLLLFPYRLLRFYAWLTLRVLQRAWKERQT